jgi:HMG-box domain
MAKKNGNAASEKGKTKLPPGVKRPTRKKPKDKPKRPLSAYNFFFKEEREKILKIVLAEDPSKVKNDEDSPDYISDAMLVRLKKDGGKVSFEEMGKLIGQRWKGIDPDRLSQYSEMAAEDTERYKKEMLSYNGRQEAKMRSEALKPPAWNAGKAAESYANPVKAPPAEAPSRPALPSGYNDTMASYANQAAAAAATMGAGFANPYAGMDLGGYAAMHVRRIWGIWDGIFGGCPGHVCCS